MTNPPPFGEGQHHFGPHQSQDRIAHVLEHGVGVDGLEAIGATVDTAEGPQPAVALIFLAAGREVGPPLLIVLPPERVDGAELGDVYEQAAALARDGYAGLDPDKTVQQAEAERAATPVTCPGCGRTLFGWVADRGLCLDCAPDHRRADGTEPDL